MNRSVYFNILQGRKVSVSLLLSPEANETFEVFGVKPDESVLIKSIEFTLIFRTTDGMFMHILWYCFLSQKMFCFSARVVGFSGTEETNATIQPSVTLGIVPKYVTTDCPVYSLTYRPITVPVSYRPQEPILFTTGQKVLMISV